MQELLESISSMIVDYADGEFGKLDENHVLRWVNQFKEEDRQVVLEETNRLLKRTYITKESFEKYISDLINSEKFYSSEQSEFWSQISLCDIQINGNSQKELNSLVKKNVVEQFGFEPKVNAISQHYIYLDDFVFSGNRIVSDLRTWITGDAPQKCHVSVVLMGWYQGGIWYVQNKLKEIAKQSNKDISFKYWSFEELRLENRLRYKNTSDVFWPEESVMDIPEVVRYIDTQDRKPAFRDATLEKNKVFSKTRRSQYELAMVKAGLQILGYCQDPNKVVKPLGYHRFDGFGFGSTVFSFRNCPNNNPLAFWWGDPTYSTAHPFGKWYPLMQRKTYG